MLAFSWNSWKLRIDEYVNACITNIHCYISFVVLFRGPTDHRQNILSVVSYLQSYQHFKTLNSIVVTTYLCHRMWSWLWDINEWKLRLKIIIATMHLKICLFVWIQITYKTNSILDFKYIALQYFILIFGTTP